jgi:hypothetical protein
MSFTDVHSYVPMPKIHEDFCRCSLVKEVGVQGRRERTIHQLYCNIVVLCAVITCKGRSASG